MQALLVVDVQRGLVEKDLYGKNSFLEVIRKAIAEFRRASRPVVFVQHCNDRLAEGSEAWELWSGLEATDSDPRVRKRHGNAFEQTELRSILAGMGIGEIVVCGLVSHGCVRATCLGGVEAGFRVRLLAGGHSCWNRDAGEKIRRMEEELRGKGVEVR